MSRIQWIEEQPRTLGRAERLEWIGQIYHTPEEIDAICQVEGDTLAASICMCLAAGDCQTSSWNNIEFTDYDTCFREVRRLEKGSCVRARLDLEEDEPVLSELDRWAQYLTTAVARGEQPSQEVLQKSGALPVRTVSVQEASAEVARQPASQFPWNTRSGSTKGLQQQVNVRLLEQGYCPINADGILGPGTCGAARAVGITTPSTCRSYTDPKRCGAAQAGGAGGKKSSALPLVLGGLVLAGVAVAVIAGRG